MKNAQPNARLRAKFGRNKTENVPVVLPPTNWGGKNKDTKVKKAQGWFARAKKAVFGEAEEKHFILGYGWSTSRLFWCLGKMVQQ